MRMSLSRPNPVAFLHQTASVRGIKAPEFIEEPPQVRKEKGETAQGHHPLLKEPFSFQGPPHLRVFIVKCVFHSMEARGQGRSKKEAKVAAAKVIAQR